MKLGPLVQLTEYGVSSIGGKEGSNWLELDIACSTRGWTQSPTYGMLGRLGKPFDVSLEPPLQALTPPISKFLSCMQQEKLYHWILTLLCIHTR